MSTRQTIEITVSESVVQKHAVTLREGGGGSDDVDDGYVFTVGASDGVQGGQLADAKGGDHSSKTVDPRIAVRSVAWRTMSVRIFQVDSPQTHTSIKLVDIAHPIQSGLRDIIESDKVIIAGDAVNGLDANLSESTKEILCEIDGSRQA